MKKVSIFLTLGLIASMLIYSCTKESVVVNDSNIQNKRVKTEEKNIAMNGGGFDKKFTTIYNPGSTVLDCTGEGTDCKKNPNGTIEIRTATAALSASIDNGTVSDFFTTGNWEILFPEIVDSDVLTNLQNGTYTMFVMSQSSGEAIFVAALATANPSTITDGEIIFAAAFD